MYASIPPFLVERTAAMLLCWIVAITYGLTMGGAGGIPCLWKTLFGMECPGCGLTRAWAFLLHGDVAAAARANWLIFPVIAGFLHHSLIFAARRQPLFLTTTFSH